MRPRAARFFSWLLAATLVSLAGCGSPESSQPRPAAPSEPTPPRAPAHDVFEGLEDDDDLPLPIPARAAASAVESEAESDDDASASDADAEPHGDPA